MSSFDTMRGLGLLDRVGDYIFYNCISWPLLCVHFQIFDFIPYFKFQFSYSVLVHYFY